MNRRFYIILSVILLLLGLWLSWPTSNPPAGNAIDDPVTSSTRHSSQASVADDGEARPEQFRPSRGRSDTGGKSGNRNSLDHLSESDQEVMRRIDHLIINDSLEHAEVAQRLSVIAAEPSLSTEVRAEAMGHGVLLDVEAFAGLARDPGLPEDLATELLGEIINHNENPIMQIQGYSDFLNHGSSDVRELATEMLRFMVEDDFEDADIPTLLRMGQEKIQELLREAAENPE